MSNSVKIGKKLIVEDVVNVVRFNEKIELPKEAIEKIQKCRNIVDKKIRNKEVMYGVTTGIGELSEVVLSTEQVKDFQKYIIYSHAAGYGNPMPIEVVRAAMLSRIGALSAGHSGVRPIIVETLVKMLNSGVTPVMCEKGSVGACGDLSPMAQMALVLMGEGEAFYKGERLNGKEAMEKAGIPIIEFEARDGLATINGSNVITGIGLLAIHDTSRWLKTSEIAAAMTLEVLNANMNAYDERLHKARGHIGSVECAANIRKITEKSKLLERKGKKVQDAYSLRSTPQVVGSGKDTIKYVRTIFETEINGVADNPLFFEDDGGTCISGANFQGTPMAFGLDFIAIAVTTICALSERRTNRLMNSHLNAGLPPFLTKGAGMFSGLMLTQYTAGALVCENRILSHPASTGSIPAAADQEDFVSMGMTSALKARQIIDNANAIIAIELMASAQAADFLNPALLGTGTKKAYDIVRKYVKYLDADRPLCGDINKLAEVVKSGEIVEEVEKAIGTLE
ncbi:MAG: histidine ammonia-lyase [bacterium]